MKIEEYQGLAARTLPDLGSQEKNGAHMALGIMSELLELYLADDNDIVNKMEEHGDMNWYIAGMCTIYGLDYAKLFSEAVVPTSDADEEVIKAFADTVDLVKRELAYGAKMEGEKLACVATLLLSFCKAYAKQENFDYIHSLQKNIEKLRTRFPDNFDAEKAIDRDVDKERETLES
jgi:NTP pyrophosphatase (non-canonical NTP hydrolase)